MRQVKYERSPSNGSFQLVKVGFAKFVLNNLKKVAGPEFFLTSSFSLLEHKNLCGQQKAFCCFATLIFLFFLLYYFNIFQNK